MLGGPSRYTARHGDGALVGRMTTPKHAHNMRPAWALRWLHHMAAATREVFEEPVRAEIARQRRTAAQHGGGGGGATTTTTTTPRARALATLAFYWRHFLGWFWFSPPDRRAITAACRADARFWFAIEPMAG